MTTSSQRSTLDEWFERNNEELRRIAAHHLARERPDHTLQATALIHEAYLKLSRQAPVAAKDDVHFRAVAARIMWQILVDHARNKAARRRREVFVSFGDPTDYATISLERCLELDSAIRALAEQRPNGERIARQVVFRLFPGLSEGEIADQLEVSSRTVRRDWRFAQAWLRRELSR